PNREGLFSDNDVASITAFRNILDETFKTNLATGKVPSSLTDKKLSTYVSFKANEPLIIDFTKPVKIDRILLQENIAAGQRIKKAVFEYLDGQEWKPLVEFTTVGYKRLLRFNEQT